MVPLDHSESTWQLVDLKTVLKKYPYILSTHVEHDLINTEHLQYYNCTNASGATLKNMDNFIWIHKELLCNHNKTLGIFEGICYTVSTSEPFLNSLNAANISVYLPLSRQPN